MGWRWNHIKGRGELEGEVQFRFATRERFQAKTCLAALLPEVCHMEKLVLGKGVCGGGPRSLRGHGG